MTNERASFAKHAQPTKFVEALKASCLGLGDRGAIGWAVHEPTPRLGRVGRPIGQCNRPQDSNRSQVSGSEVYIRGKGDVQAVLTPIAVQSSEPEGNLAMNLLPARSSASLSGLKRHTTLMLHSAGGGSGTFGACMIGINTAQFCGD